MKLPKKITPDRIRQAVVEVKYSSHLPFEVLIGIFFNALDDSYIYTNRPQSKPPSITLGDNVPITLQIGQTLFYNDKISIALLPNAFAFSCLNDYIGWEAYKPEIEKTVTALYKTEVITNFTRIGIRYVSEYPNINLKDCVNFEFTFGMKDVKSDTFTFKTEFNFDIFKVVLNLNNKVPFLEQSDKALSIIPTSVIDIDVILDGLIINDLNELFGKIELGKLKEKEIFFQYLIREDFLKTLKPEY